MPTNYDYLQNSEMFRPYRPLRGANIRIISLAKELNKFMRFIGQGLALSRAKKLFGAGRVKQAMETEGFLECLQSLGIEYRKGPRARDRGFTKVALIHSLTGRPMKQRIRKEVQ